MRAAVIDVGTNSTRLLIGERCDSQQKIILQLMETTRLGQGVTMERKLSEEGMQRTLRVISDFVALARKYAVTKIVIFGTSAVRDAANKAIFARQVYEQTGIKLLILNGADEARLSFIGAVNGVAAQGKYFVVADIGGGSTEVVIGSKANVLFAESVDIGAVRLTEMFLHSDPILQSEYVDMERYVRAVLKKVVEKLSAYEIDQLIAVGGTATSMAAVALGLQEYDATKVHGYILARKRLAQIISELRVMTIAERARVWGLQPQRADIIVGGAAILLALAEMSKKEKMIISEADIMQGVLQSL